MYPRMREALIIHFYLFNVSQYYFTRGAGKVIHLLFKIVRLFLFWYVVYFDLRNILNNIDKYFTHFSIHKYLVFAFMMDSLLLDA